MHITWNHFINYHFAWISKKNTPLEKTTKTPSSILLAFARSVMVNPGAKRWKQPGESDAMSSIWNGPPTRARSLLSVRLQCMGSRYVKSKHITIRFLFCVGLANNESINPISSCITAWKIQAKTGHGEPLEVKVSKLDNVRRMLTCENPKCCIKSPGQPLEVNRSAASSSKSVSTSVLFLGPFMPQPLSRRSSMSMHCRTIPMIAGFDDKRPLTVPLRILSVTWCRLSLLNFCCDASSAANMFCLTIHFGFAISDIDLQTRQHCSLQKFHTLARQMILPHVHPARPYHTLEFGGLIPNDVIHLFRSCSVELTVDCLIRQ